MFSSFFSLLIILSFRIIYHIICQKVCYIDFNLYFQTASIGSPQEFQSPAVIRTSTPTAHLAQGPLVTKKLPPASPKQYYIDPFNHHVSIPDIKISIPNDDPIQTDSNMYNKGHQSTVESNVETHVHPNVQPNVPQVVQPSVQCSVQSDLHPFIQQCASNSTPLIRDLRLPGQSVSNISNLHPQVQPVNQHLLYNQSVNKSNMMSIQVIPPSADPPSADPPSTVNVSHNSVNMVTQNSPYFSTGLPDMSDQITCGQQLSCDNVSGVTLKSSFSDLPQHTPRRRERKQDIKRATRSFDDMEASGAKSSGNQFDSYMYHQGKFNGYGNHSNVSNQSGSEHRYSRDSLTDTQLEQYVNGENMC